jgi:predicted XRE-type DNA-binding protein
VRFSAAVFVLHVFQKKAMRGIATPRQHGVGQGAVESCAADGEGATRTSNTKAKGMEVEMGTGNVYADLGFADADEMLIKAQLVSKIAEIIKRKGLTQTQAAQLLGMPQPKLSNLLSGRFRGVSERRLMDCLTKLGRDVQIVVEATPRSRKDGRLSIVFA